MKTSILSSWALWVGIFGSVVMADMPHFRFHLIGLASDSAFPVQHRYFRESVLPADVDGDGDLDFFLGDGRGGGSYWFENQWKSRGAWPFHHLSDSNDTDVGSAVFDVDGDGYPDKVAGSFWYHNPGLKLFASNQPLPADPTFPACRMGEMNFIHDMLAADIDGDSRNDLVSILYDGIRWFKIPKDTTCQAWPEIKVSQGKTDPQQHGGIAAGDLDGDGDADISRMDRWYENSDGKGQAWVEHLGLGFDKAWEKGWGLSGRSLIADVDGDGTHDVLEAECDMPNGRVAWFRNGGKGKDWEMHLVKDSTDGQDFHSILFLDFDGDGDRDLFSIGSGVSAEKPKAYFWENADGHGKSWKETSIDIGYNGHDAGAADVDGDGDADILLYEWDGEGAVYWLENTLVTSAIDDSRKRSDSEIFHSMRSQMKPFRSRTSSRQINGRKAFNTQSSMIFRPLPTSP